LSLDVLALKLAVVPTFLLLLSFAGRRWGPAVAGWLAGLPLVVGPILAFIAFEQGAAFAAPAASAALAAVSATVVFIVAYAHGARRARWPLALAGALVAWGAAAFVVSHVPAAPGLSLALALAALVAAPRLFPPTGAMSGGRAIGRGELVARMVAGALLTLGVTLAAAAVGPRWSGLLAVFPVLASVLAVFSHRAQGAAFATALLRSMTAGMYSLVAFCLVAALALPGFSAPVAFALALGATVAVQAATRRRPTG
jgi:hypothetical protein